VCPDPSNNKQKVRKTLISRFLYFLLLSLKTDVNLGAKNIDKILFFVGILKATEEKSRIRIRKPAVRIRGF
jgi:hypothetical protein